MANSGVKIYNGKSLCIRWWRIKVSCQE